MPNKAFLSGEAYLATNEIRIAVRLLSISFHSMCLQVLFHVGFAFYHCLAAGLTRLGFNLALDV